MSNEEWAAFLLEGDIRSYEATINGSEYIFMKDSIHATSFGQSSLKKDDPKYRDYIPSTFEQKLLVFADIGGAAIDGWEYWLRESLQVMQESGKYPNTLEEWIKERSLFLDHVEALSRDISPSMKKSIRDTIGKNLTLCRKNLDSLISEELPEEQKMIERTLGISL